MASVFSITFVERPSEEWLYLSLLSVTPLLQGVYLVFIGEGYKNRDTALKALEGWNGIFLEGETSGEGSIFEKLEEPVCRARLEGCTHVLLLHPWEIYPRSESLFCRELLEQTELKDSTLGLPPRQHGKRRDPEPTDGVLIRHLGLKKVVPSMHSPARGRVDPGFHVRWINIQGLEFGKGKGMVEPTGEGLDESPYRLNLPTTHFWSMEAIEEVGGPLPGWVKIPEVLKAKQARRTKLVESWERGGFAV